MRQKLLFNTRCKIQISDLLLSNRCNITMLDKPKNILKVSGKINHKNFNLLKHSSVLRGPILPICTFVGNIKPITAKYLSKNYTVINLKFNIDKTKYADFSSLIYQNIDDLYSRIIKLYAITKQRLINKGLDYVDDTYEINEKIFKRILNNIEAYNFNKYSDITDKLIITEIIKYFRSST